MRDLTGDMPGKSPAEIDWTEILDGVLYHYTVILVSSLQIYQITVNRGCCFLVQAMLPEGFPFHQFNITYYNWCLVPVWRL